MCGPTGRFGTPWESAVAAASAVAGDTNSLFGWLVVDGWCWFVLREEYCWLVAGGRFVVREKYCWLVADKPSEQGGRSLSTRLLVRHAASVAREV
jgi:hypothetical protein